MNKFKNTYVTDSEMDMETQTCNNENELLKAFEICLGVIFIDFNTYYDMLYICIRIAQGIEETYKTYKVKNAGLKLLRLLYNSNNKDVVHRISAYMNEKHHIKAVYNDASIEDQTWAMSIILGGK